MILERLSLHNVRSYTGEETNVEFPLGTVLFEGDIGSGKSTLLYAVEFALFGFGDMSGAYLLTEGQNDGHVTLRFSEGGRSYEIRRGLKRRKNSVAQDDCYIAWDGKKEALSPSDLKARVIDILKFNEPSNPRAESLIYRFAIFTPQEQMKEIVQRKVDERLQILRRVFGVEEYKVAADNSDLVRGRLRVDISRLMGETAALEQKQEELEEVEREVVRLEKQIPVLDREEQELSKKVNELSEQQKQLQSDRGRIQEISAKIPELRNSVSRLQRQVESEQKSVAEDTERLKAREAEVASFRMQQKPAEMTVTQAEEMLDSIRNSISQKKVNRGKLELQLKDTSDLIERGVCPTCGQTIDPSSFGGKAEHLRKELKALNEEIAALEEELRKGNERLKSLREFEEQMKNSERLEAESQEIRKRLDLSNSKLKEYLGELDRARIRLAQAQEEASTLESVQTRIRQLDTELARYQSEWKKARDSATAAKTQREEKYRRKEELEKEIAQMKTAKERAERLREYEIWLEDYFKPTVGMIETQIMVEMNARFNQEFQRFFSAMVDDPDVQVRVNEEFTPVFERQGYEQEYDALSGGERTSIALAYRLALNVIVQEEATTGAGDLLIMDEPTDGFSKEQLSRMRDILKALNCKQVILVSHERELEAMADRVFKVEKGSGGSKVTIYTAA